jgi:hypothetical protein
MGVTFNRVGMVCVGGCGGRAGPTTGLCVVCIVGNGSSVDDHGGRIGPTMRSCVVVIAGDVCSVVVSNS